MNCIIRILSVVSLFALWNEPLNSAFPEKDSKLKKWFYILGESAEKINNSYFNNVLSGTYIICITGFKVNKNGYLIYNKLVENGFLQKAITYKAVIYPCISFLSVKDGEIMLSSAKARNNAINEILSLAEEYRFEGINLDFEYLGPDNINNLVSFLNRLRSSCRSMKLTMVIFPQVGFPEKWSRFHDPDRISRFLDEIVIMCYDLHRFGTSPGPVVDLEWAEKNIQRIIKYANPDKIWLGVPAYGYVWNEKGNRPYVISSKKGKVFSRKYGGRRHKSGTVYYKYKKAGKSYIAFFSDIVTIGGLEKLAKQYGLKGTALWRLGFEEDEYWK